MPLIDLRFRVIGDSVPKNNAYLVFAAASKALGGEHLPNDIGVFPLTGMTSGNRMLITENSAIGFRCSPERIPLLLGLCGQQLAIGNHEVTVGTSSVYPIKTSPSMFARMVTFKDALEESAFLERANYKLKEKGIKGTATIPRWHFRPTSSLPQQRVVEIQGKRIVGFSVRVDGLSESDAARLIDAGMGGRRHMGCGLFIPARTN
jgi:CRISPR-associated protein Cas6